MARYQLIADLDINTSDLEVAYTEAERMIALGAAALGRATPFITVAVAAMPQPRTNTIFSVEVPCGKTRPRGTVSVSFSPAERRGAVVVYDGDSVDNAVTTYSLTAESLRWLVRGLMLWPLDLLDDLAREDEIARRRAGRGGES